MKLLKRKLCLYLDLCVQRDLVHPYWTTSQKNLDYGPCSDTHVTFGARPVTTLSLGFHFHKMVKLVTCFANSKELLLSVK